MVNNPHRLVLSMSPDNDYVEKLTKAEAEILENKVKSLSDEQKELVGRIQSWMKFKAI